MYVCELAFWHVSSHGDDETTSSHDDDETTPSHDDDETTPSRELACKHAIS